jgi:hypothetical protein
MLELLIVIASIAAPTDSDSDSSEQHTTPSPPTVCNAPGGQTTEELARTGKSLRAASAAAKNPKQSDVSSFSED